MDQIFDTDAPGAVGTPFSPLGPGLSWKSSGKDSMKKNNSDSYLDKLKGGGEGGEGRESREEKEKREKMRNMSVDDSSNINNYGNYYNQGSQYDFTTNMSSHRNIDGKDSKDKGRPKDKDGRGGLDGRGGSRIDMMTVNPMLASVFTEDENDEGDDKDDEGDEDDEDEYIRKNNAIHGTDSRVQHQGSKRDVEAGGSGYDSASNEKGLREDDGEYIDLA